MLWSSGGWFFSPPVDFLRTVSVKLIPDWSHCLHLANIWPIIFAVCLFMYTNCTWHQPLGLFHARLIIKSTSNHMTAERENTAYCQHVSLRLCTITDINGICMWQRFALTGSVMPNEWLLLMQQRGVLFATAAPHKVWARTNHMYPPLIFRRLGWHG